MSDKKDGDEHKQSTQAIAQEPQEEFIAPENIPSKTENDARESRGNDAPKPPRE